MPVRPKALARRHPAHRTHLPRQSAPFRLPPAGSKSTCSNKPAARRTACTSGRSKSRIRRRPARAHDLNRLLPLSDGVISIALRGDGAILALGDRTGGVSLVETRTRRVVGTIHPASADSESLWLAMAFSPDGRNLAMGSPDGLISVWSVDQPRKPRLRFHLPGHRGAITCLVFDAQNRRLASSGSEPLVEVWDLDLIERELSRLGLSD